MNRFASLLLRLIIATVIAGVLLLVGVVFTTVMFHSDQHPGDLGRTWQDNLLIATVLFLYAGYAFRIISDFFKSK